VDKGDGLVGVAVVGLKGQ